MNRSLFIRFGCEGGVEKVEYELKMTVRDAILATLEHENFGYDTEVSVTFCDNGYIRALNKEHRGIDKSTDVLSFPMYEDGEFDAVECSECAVIGDIVISLERAREQAEEIGNTFMREVAFLAIHSTLHLLGYDHERSEEDDELQCSAQREIFKTLKAEEV